MVIAMSDPRILIVRLRPQQAGEISGAAIGRFAGEPAVRS